MRPWLGAMLVSLAVLSPGPSRAEPAGPVVLTITGAIAPPGGGHKVEFDRAALERLAGRTTLTSTPWTHGVVQFSGPLGRSLLEAVGATGKTLRVTALNDYAAEIPVQDFYDYDVILATRIDGEPISVRSRGPVFVIYPFDEAPELYTEQYFARSVWQVARIEVR